MASSGTGGAFLLRASPKISWFSPLAANFIIFSLWGILVRDTKPWSTEMRVWAPWGILCDDESEPMNQPNNIDGSQSPHPKPRKEKTERPTSSNADVEPIADADDDPVDDEPANPEAANR